MIQDPGPMARFEDVIAKPDTMGVIVQRLTEGETLKQIAKAWKIPYGKLAEWVAEDSQRASAYSTALEIWADSLAQECVAISDEQAQVTTGRGTTYDPDVPRDKLRIETRMRLASRLARSRYGDSTEVRHTGSVSLVAILSGMPKGNVIEAEEVPVLEQKVPAKIPAPPVMVI